MPHKIVKSIDQTVRISRNWQITFIVVMIGSYVASASVTTYLYTRSGSYISSGTWWYQASQFSFPVAYLAFGLLFAWRRYKSMLHRMFWGVLTAAIGITAFGVLSLVATSAYYRFFGYGTFTSDKPGLLATFGFDWSLMAISFGIYCLGLIYIARKRH